MLVTQSEANTTVYVRELGLTLIMGMRHGMTPRKTIVCFLRESKKNGSFPTLELGGSYWAPAGFAPRS